MSEGGVLIETRIGGLENEVRDTNARIGCLEDKSRDMKAILVRLEPMIIRIDAQLPSLATKEKSATVRADLAEKPSRVYLWGILAVLLAAYGCGLAAIAVLR